MLIREQAQFETAVRLRSGHATISDVYTFISGLYFRGKMAYSTALAAPPPGQPHAMVIVPGRGLLTCDTPVSLAELRQIPSVPVDETDPAYREPLLASARALAACDADIVLLGSIATARYTGPLLEVFGERLKFPAEFVGRGDMSRGGLMLRHAASRTPLTYIPVAGATRKGTRPPKLDPLRRRPAE
jgi:hypothetical protein